MEGQQCDGCDFRATSHDELKLHIQDVHTVFLLPGEVGAGSPHRTFRTLSHTREGEQDLTCTQELSKGSRSFSPGSAGFASPHAPGPTQPTRACAPFFQCRYCVRYFRSRALLEEHSRRLHGAGGNMAVRDAVGKMYSCQYCSYKSPRRGRLLKHQRSHHRDAPCSEPRTRPPPPPDPRDAVELAALESMVTPRSGGGFVCEWCGHMTQQRRQMCDHLMRKHGDTVKLVASLHEPGVKPRGNAVAAGGGASATPGPSDARCFHGSRKIPGGMGTSLPSRRFLSDPARGLAPSVHDSRSSSDGEMGEAGETGEVGETGELLLTEEDSRVLEAEGIPIRRFLGVFQCPFCAFVAKLRRGVSRHIECTHLPGGTTLHRCDQCAFICTAPATLAAHRRSHRGTSSEPEVLDLTGEGPDGHQGDPPELRVNGKRTPTPPEESVTHRCLLCSFSTSSLKGLRVHQQNKHAYCDGLQGDAPRGSPSEAYVHKTHTSILGHASRKRLGGRTARKSINDVPLDLSPLKKRTRIDEIASNLQSKISQQRGSLAHEVYGGGAGGVRSSHASRGPALTVSDDDEEVKCQGGQDVSDAYPEHMDYSAEPGSLFYCKHCEYQNKSARSVSTHYQRMHPYIKFSFKYILDPEDRSAVFRCLECLVEYENFGDLHQHYMEQHPEASNVLNLNQPDLVYACRFCSYTSPNVRSLMPHYQRMHPSVKINNAMIFSSYVVDQPHKELAESQTLREILNSGPRGFPTPGSPAPRDPGRTPDHTPDAEPFSESLDENAVVYDCDVCSFSSPNMHSVLVHYQKKHPEQKASYFRIQKTMRVASGAPPAPPKSRALSHLSPDDEVYYCKHCVYSNRSVVGVLVHYQKRHPEIKVTAKYIKHAAPTPGLMRLMEELQIAPPTQLLKPLSNNSAHSSPKGTPERNHTEMLYFCQHCDYGNRTVKGVLIHYQKKHRDTRANADLVRRHTAVVRSQRERAQMGQTGGPAPTGDAQKPRPLRALKCRHCVFTSPYVYALKKHLKKDHPTVKATATTILRWAYQEGVLEAGYHCEWCIYSHGQPSGLLMHYQRRHPEHNVDYAYMASKLWAGPEAPISAPPEPGRYRCTDCAFEARSAWDVTEHYQAAHAWAVQDDASTSGLFGSSQSDEVGRHHELSSSAYQCAVCLSEYNSLHGLLTHYGKKHPGMKVKAADFAQEADINPGSVYKCRHCPYVNSRIHGVLTHYQKRHPLVKVTAEDFAHDVEDAPDREADPERSKTQRQGYGAYRCKLCAYSHGTFEKLKLHYERYHAPADAPRSPEQDRLPERREFQAEPAEQAEPGKHTLFRCQLCKYFCSTRKGIARHYRVKHNNVRAQPEGKNNVFKCALCSYTNPIRKGLAAHYQKRHDIDAYYTHCLAASKSVQDAPPKVTLPPVSEETGSAMSAELRCSIEQKKCSLCSFQAFSRKSIISHYVKRHPGVFPKKRPASKLGRYFTVIYSKEPEGRDPECDPGRDPGHDLECDPGLDPGLDPGCDSGRDHECDPGLDPRLDHERDPRRDPGDSPLKCAMCSGFGASTVEQLVAHYNDAHAAQLRRDFVTTPGEGVTERYCCTHCGGEFLSLPELSPHLLLHHQHTARRAWAGRSNSAHSSTPQDKMKVSDDKSPVGYRCNFCDELHPTLRAICNHLRKHVQYKEKNKASVEVQEVVEVPGDVIANGAVEDAVTTETGVEMEDGAPPAPGAVAAVARAAQHECNMCDRVFMSMQGLRSHERSHFAAAYISKQDKYSCQYCHFQSAFRHNLDRHVQTHHGQHKPFRCKLCSFKSSYLSRLKSHLHKTHAGENTYKCVSCSFSTMTISQLKEHSLREHGETLTLTRLRAGTSLRSTHPTNHALSTPTSHINTQHTSITDEEDTHGEYLEPPDVQQQLNHFQLAAGNLAPPTPRPGSPDPSPPEELETSPHLDSALTCEFCEFTSGYMQSLRRHYRDRHGGKKLFKCKDCSFFTCSRATFTLHVHSGHAGVSSEAVGDLRCPFCLYHTKSKSHMIDHVLLHREERVIPLEVSRSKLSRHLEGLIFRCDKCTFTCSSAENLQQHVSKHQEPKPYQCCLCYYDNKHQQQLEEHLRREHKVIRNFELMGRVNLDQLDALNGIHLSEEEEEEEEEGIQEEVKDRQVERKQEVESSVESAGAVTEVSLSLEKRFPCEFCGRTFSVSLELERHVLRHGLAVNHIVRASSPVTMVTVTDRITDQSANTTGVERAHRSSQSESSVHNQHD